MCQALSGAEVSMRVFPERREGNVRQWSVQGPAGEGIRQYGAITAVAGRTVIGDVANHDPALARDVESVTPGDAC